MLCNAVRKREIFDKETDTLLQKNVIKECAQSGNVIVTPFSADEMKTIS